MGSPLGLTGQEAGHGFSLFGRLLRDECLGVWCNGSSAPTRVRGLLEACRSIGRRLGRLRVQFGSISEKKSPISLLISAWPSSTPNCASRLSASVRLVASSAIPTGGIGELLALLLSADVSASTWIA